MNVLAIADKRPQIDITQVVAENNVQLIITLGDLTPEDIIALKDITNIPKIGVYGNHCSGTYMPALGIMNMHLQMWDYNGLRYGGFQGCVRYKENPQAIMCTQEEATEHMATFQPVDIFISHCPPYGINDEPDETAHQGFYALRQYLDAYSPKVWLHGHTYPTAEEEVKQYKNTRIEYVAGYKLIQLP